MDRTRIVTADGSPSLFVPELNETYHSRHGAVTESEYVFIENGLRQCTDRGTLHILEVGMGTALNVLLTMQHRNDRIIRYTALEPYPLERHEWENLQFTCNRNGHFETIHNQEFEKTCEIAPGFFLTKHCLKLLDFNHEPEYSLVYFDAFAPSRQPDMWTPEVFRKTYSIMRTGGLLATYCASGNARRSMAEAGFSVSRLKGPPGKKEMLRAVR
ncbi:MAG: tRNA (5-methylaminomethyl-2-thiouridine)(34)-methyltransferase MnmD [Bacteroidia bacterium]|nr:tRNA (5-methylaminomethyl-2-thiouridine)(34)-methyltransferase MnmD [Bacteroidia bacterium]